MVDKNGAVKHYIEDCDYVPLFFITFIFKKTCRG